MAASDLDISRSMAGIWEVDNTPRRLVAPPGARLSMKNIGANPVLLRTYDDAFWTNTDPAAPVNADGEVVLLAGDTRQFGSGVSIMRARCGAALPTKLAVTIDNN